MNWFDNFKEDPIIYKKFQHPTMKVDLLLHNNNGSDTDMMVGTLF